MKPRTVAITLLAAVSAGLAPIGVLCAMSVGRTSDVADAPATDVALVLGAQAEPDGTPSAFLRGRLEVAKALYDAGKVRVLLVSGDNRSQNYDEPTVMRNWLVAHGVPEDRVVRDHAGLDTYDSCVRAKEIFGVTRLTVVSQGYHVPRAVATCRMVGVDAVGVGDGSVARPHPRSWWKGVAREGAAAWKTLLDVGTSRTPVLGPRETSVDDALAAS